MPKKLIIIVAILLFALVISAAIFVIFPNYLYRSIISTSVEQAEQAQGKPLRCHIPVALQIAEEEGKPRICQGGTGDDGYIEVLFGNEYVIDIVGLVVSVTGEKGVFENNSIPVTLPAGSESLVSISYSPEKYGIIKQLRVVPKIKIENAGVMPCDGSPVEKAGGEIETC